MVLHSTDIDPNVATTLGMTVEYKAHDLVDLWITDIECKDSLEEIEELSHTNRTLLEELSQGQFVNGAKVRFDCGLGRKMTVGSNEVQAQDYTCQWDTKWDPIEPFSVCECKDRILCISIGLSVFIECG